MFSMSLLLGKDEPLKLHYGLYLPNFGKVSHAKIYAKLALIAERAGWDGFFLWDHLIQWNQRIPITDPFIALAAIAAKTSHIRIGTTVTPLPRLQPWIIARQVASLDQLSDGRMTLGVGLGEEESTDYERFGMSCEKKVLAGKLDEALDIITGLWKGKAFTYDGQYYQILKETTFLPTPKQKPRVPVWVGGFWPNKGPFRRAARWDGVIPLKLRGQPVRPAPQDLRDILEFIAKHRANKGHFDATIIGWGTGRNRDQNVKKIGPYVKSGLTWWLESLYSDRDSVEKMRKRILMGPPRF
jgi:alkanesulfonate monooxygenase SsuD/methylene tetrahydromethanopterin reductase-like flavin-dependent oxidoreductase (luciferase family)